MPKHLAQLRLRVALSRAGSAPRPSLARRGAVREPSLAGRSLRARTRRQDPSDPAGLDEPDYPRRARLRWCSLTDLHQAARWWCASRMQLAGASVRARLGSSPPRFEPASAHERGHDGLRRARAPELPRGLPTVAGGARERHGRARRCYWITWVADPWPTTLPGQSRTVSTWPARSRRGVLLRVPPLFRVGVYVARCAVDACWRAGLVCEVLLSTSTSSCDQAAWGEHPS